MKTVQVLMSTYNGEKYLKEQIESILSQEGVNVSLLIRDDGSKDNTKEIIKEYLNDDRVSLIEGENIGFVKSFLTLLDMSFDADYYAFADQDDVWVGDKLKCAIDMLMTEDRSIPLLYCSSLQRVDEQLNYLNIQDYPGLIINLPSMLTRGRLAGCTFVYNQTLRNLVRTSSTVNIHASHDSWVLLACLACGGKVIFDQESHILFRRHGTNTSIDGGSLLNRVRYEFRYFGKSKDKRLNTADELLSFFDNNISEDGRNFLEKVSTYKKNILNRIRLAFCRDLNCGIKLSNIITTLTILFGNY